MNEADLAGSRLAGFLQSQKELFLGDLESGKGKGWTVAVGNEAGGKLVLLGRKSREADQKTWIVWYHLSHSPTSLPP